VLLEPVPLLLFTLWISLELDLLPMSVQEEPDNSMDWLTVYKKFSNQMDYKDFIKDLEFPLLELLLTEHVISEDMIPEKHLSGLMKKKHPSIKNSFSLKSLLLFQESLLTLLIPLEEE